MRILDTRLHGGLPQSRRRVYIVGWLKSRQVAPWSWPADVPMKPLSSILTSSIKSSFACTGKAAQANTVLALKSLAQRHSVGFRKHGGSALAAPDANDCVVDIGASPKHGGGKITVGYSPCLTKTRAKVGGHYLLGKGRMMTLTEMERLQGFPHLVIPPGVSCGTYAGMLGNAFTLTVAGKVALALLRTTGKSTTTWSEPIWPPAMLT